MILRLNLHLRPKECKDISVTTVDGVKQSPIINEATFTYTYDSEYARASVYDIEGMYLTSTFEIRSGFLYEVRLYRWSGI